MLKQAVPLLSYFLLLLLQQLLLFYEVLFETIIYCTTVHHFLTCSDKSAIFYRIDLKFWQYYL